jgi:glutamate dehydrogenase
VQWASIAEREAVLRMNEYRSLMSSLESRGVLDRGLEFLPADDALIERSQKGLGLTRPELAVLTCYVKGQLKLEILASDIPENAYLAQSLENAFPALLCQRHRDSLYQHQLRREIVATQIANDVVDFMGITFLERMSQSTSAGVAEIVRAYVVARDVFDLHRWWEAVEGLDNAVAAARQLEIFADLQRLIRLAARWFLNNRRGGIDVQVEVDAFATPVRAIQAGMREFVQGEQLAAWERRHAELLEGGIPDAIAAALAGSTMLIGALGMVDVARISARPVDEIARIAFDLNERLGLYWFGKQITALKVDNYWQALARESFLDELDWQVRSIVALVGASAGDEEACARVSRWLEAQSHPIERWQRMVAEIRGAVTQDYAMYAVAVRGLLALAQPSGGSAA